MVEVLVVLPNGVADVAVHNLRVKDVVDELQAPGADAFYELDAPGRVVALIIGMGAFAVEEFHAEGDFQFFRERQNAFQAGGAIFQAGFVVQAVAVAGETNQAREPGSGSFAQSLFVDLREYVMMFEAVERFGNSPQAVQVREADHGTDEAVFFEDRKIHGVEQVNGGETHFLYGTAEVVQRDFMVAPAADGMVDAVFHGERILNT